MDSTSYDLYEFQKKSKKKLLKQLQEVNHLILSGDNGSGKSCIISTLELQGYNKCILSGKIENKFEELGVFKATPMYSIKRKYIKPTKEVLTVLSSFLGIDAAVSSVYNLIESALPADSLYFIEQMKSPTLLIIDHIELMDSSSLHLIEQIIKLAEMNYFEDLKLVIVQNNNSNYFNVEYPIIKLGNILKKDCEALGINSNTKQYRDIPLTVILDYSKNNEASSLQEYISSKFESITKRLKKNSESTFLLQTLYLYQSFTSEPWIQCTTLKSHLHQNRFFEFQTYVSFLIECKVIKKSKDSRFISLEERYIPYLNSYFKHIEVEERSYVYLDYLDQKEPFNYYDKYVHYFYLNNKELAVKNAFLAYAQLVKEHGTSPTTNKILEFTKTQGNPILAKLFKDVYTAYSHNSYMETFHHAESFLENLQGHYYAYSLEIVCELYYIKSLSLTRSINRESERTRHIEERDIEKLQKLAKEVEGINTELYCRLLEAILILSNAIRNSELSSLTADIYHKIYSIYHTQISKSSPKTVEFWMIRLASLLGKIDMLKEMSGIDEVPIMERAYNTITQYKLKYPHQFLRVSCNYAGVLYANENYPESLHILNDAISFIEKKQSRGWGIIYQMKAIFSLASGMDADKILRTYEKVVWNDSLVRNQMHEDYICISNYVLLLLASTKPNKIEKSIQYLEKSLSIKPPTSHYDQYLIHTNLGVAKYLKGEYMEAFLIEKSNFELLEKIIPYFDNNLLKKRHQLLLNLYANTSTSELGILDLICEDPELSTNPSYFRMGLFSTIAYWSS